MLERWVGCVRSGATLEKTLKLVKDHRVNNVDVYNTPLGHSAFSSSSLVESGYSSQRSGVNVPAQLAPSPRILPTWFSIFLRSHPPFVRGGRRSPSHTCPSCLPVASPRQQHHMTIGSCRSQTTKKGDHKDLRLCSRQGRPRRTLPCMCRSVPRRGSGAASSARDVAQSPCVSE